MRAVCFRFFLFSFFTFLSLIAFPPQVQSIWRGLSDFHYYSFRMFSRLGIPALPSDPEGGGFITFHAWAMVRQRSLRYTTVFNLDHDRYCLHNLNRSLRRFFWIVRIAGVSRSLHSCRLRQVLRFLCHGHGCLLICRRLPANSRFAFRSRPRNVSWECLSITVFSCTSDRIDVVLACAQNS